MSPELRTPAPPMPLAPPSHGEIESQSVLVDTLEARRLQAQGAILRARERHAERSAEKNAERGRELAQKVRFNQYLGSVALGELALDEHKDDEGALPAPRSRWQRMKLNSAQKQGFRRRAAEAEAEYSETYHIPSLTGKPKKIAYWVERAKIATDGSRDWHEKIAARSALNSDVPTKRDMYQRSLDKSLSANRGISDRVVKRLGMRGGSARRTDKQAEKVYSRLTKSEAAKNRKKTLREGRDLVTVARAFHGIDQPAFKERRVLRRGERRNRLTDRELEQQREKVRNARALADLKKRQVHEYLHSL